MKRSLFVCLIVLLASPVFGENYLLVGGQQSQINYTMEQIVKPSSGTRKLILNFVVPEDFNSPTYRQKIKNLEFNFFPPPSSRKNSVDERGNKIIEVTWKAPLTRVKTTVRLNATNSMSLEALQTNAPFPLTGLPKQARMYLKSSEQVDTNNLQIRAKAKQLTDSAKTEFDAVQKILTWVVDHMNYVVAPLSYDATYSLINGKGNCQNYSHLAAALMRVIGIPVRIVNGISLKQPYDIKIENTILTMKMAQGRHSWIEVYFPELGWIPFDPQVTEMFVSNRFIRVEVGLDNNETRQDGLMRWAQSQNNTGQPHFEENISANFVADDINIIARKMNYGPRGLLLCPQVKAAFSKVSPTPLKQPPGKVSEDDLKRLRFIIPYVFGNLDFPENVNFLSARGPAQQSEEGTMEMRKNFLVETAEYVTTQGNQYAQTFMLSKPIELKKVGLALHKFGSDGQLWLELFKDDRGKPGGYIATSDIVAVESIKFTPGYSWVNFQFNNSQILLSPGRYWVALGFTGSPIVNWFFTYGKPVGPQDGTRYKTMFDETWSRSLSYEFNYRVVGLTTE